MALGKHLIQAVPFVYALQCLTGNVDNNNSNTVEFMHYLNCCYYSITDSLSGHF